MKKIKDRPEQGYQKYERRKSNKEVRLLDTLKYWGFHRAAAEMDVIRERIDLDVAIASWKDYPAVMDQFPKTISKVKVKIDLDSLPIPI